MLMFPLEALMPIEWVNLILQHPGSMVVLLFSLITAVWYLAVMFSNIQHMQRVMVTKKDLEIALQGCINGLNGRYVLRREWELTKRRAKELT